MFFIIFFGLFVKQYVNNGYNNCLVVISYRHTVTPPAVTDRTVSVQTRGDCVLYSVGAEVEMCIQYCY